MTNELDYVAMLYAARQCKSNLLNLSTAGLSVTGLANDMLECYVLRALDRSAFHYVETTFATIDRLFFVCALRAKPIRGGADET